MSMKGSDYVRGFLYVALSPTLNFKPIISNNFTIKQHAQEEV